MRKRGESSGEPRDFAFLLSIGHQEVDRITDEVEQIFAETLQELADQFMAVDKWLFIGDPIAVGEKK